ncbi:MAG: hypothetical protein HY340_01730 [Candidatus Kerfeldbacteria bacterium]|nr:hypothetical protein [Candidatus Kerfeldbacteria bacterium]
MPHRQRNVWLRFAAFISLLVLPAPTLAAFSPHYLLSDSDILNGGGLTKAGIQDFLQRKGSGLATRRFLTPDGEKSAALIIYEVGKRWGISQKYLLVRLQVEQSLVTSANPTQRQLDRAAGYGCPDSSGCSDEFKGFFNQVDWSAKALVGEKYFGGISAKGYTISGWGPNITKRTLDGIDVTPVNAATAVLYTYTPWVGKYGGGRQDVGGSSLVWKKYNEWFYRKFPEGTLVREAGTDNYYRIEGGKRRLYRSLTILTSNTDPKKAITVSPAELSAYEPGAPIVFANYSLIQSPRGTVFLIVDSTKRGITSREVFRTIGFNPEEVQKASFADLDLYPDGPVIDLTSSYPAGALLRAKETGGIAYVENGVRHAIVAKEILKSRYAIRPVITVAKEELEAIPEGDPVTFADGDLVAADGDASVYFISGGFRRPIASRDAFDRLGFLWKNIIRTTPKALSVHPLGEPVTVEEPIIE